jgi:phosphoserine phosphatase
MGSTSVFSRCSDLDQCGLWRVLDVTRAMSAPVDLQLILQQVVDAAREVLDAERGTVFLFDAQRNELYSRVATGEETIRFPATAGLAGEAAQTRKLINVPDCYADPRFNRDIDRKTGYHTRCLLSVPLIGFDDRLVGVLQVLNKRHGVFDVDDEQVAKALAAQCAVALQRAMLIEEHVGKQKLERDLALAREIQMGVLPTRLPEYGGYELAGWSQPADETGGDIYDVVALDDTTVALLLGDATGHGIGPALSVTQMRAMFRMALRLDATLDAMFQQVNEQLVEDLPANRFVTAFLGVLDTVKHRLAYHSGGQGPLLHYHASEGRCQWLNASAVPLGIMVGAPPVRPTDIELKEGDIFAMMSDGIYEYQNTDGRQFGTARVEEVFQEHHAEPLSVLVEALLTAVRQFGGDEPQGDDMTVLMFRRLR